MAFTTWSTTDLANVTLSGGNLIATASAANGGVRGKDPKRAGKFYIEYTSTTTQNSISGVGFATGGPGPLSNSSLPASVKNTAGTGFLIGWNNSGTQVFSFNLGIGLTTGTVVCVAIDLDTRQVWMRSGAAGNWNNSASNNPATGVGGQSLAAVGLGAGIDCYPYAFLGNSANSVTLNAGASAFTGAVPSGFTSGWDDSVAAVSYMVPSQIGTETWLTTNPAMQLTQVGIETWVPANSYTVDSYSGLIRETLLATDGRANVSGLVREVLRSTGSSGITFVAMSGLVREVLRAGTPAIISLLPDFIPSSEIVYPPSLATTSILRPGFISDADTVYPPTLFGAQSLQPGFIVDGDTIYPPFLRPGRVTVTPDFIAGSETVWPPTVIIPRHVGYSALFNVPPGRFRC